MFGDRFSVGCSLFFFVFVNSLSPNFLFLGYCQARRACWSYNVITTTFDEILRIIYLHGCVKLLWTPFATLSHYLDLSDSPKWNKEWIVHILSWTARITWTNLYKISFISFWMPQSSVISRAKRRRLTAICFPDSTKSVNWQLDWTLP